MEKYDINPSVVRKVGKGNWRVPGSYFGINRLAREKKELDQEE